MSGLFTISGASFGVYDVVLVLSMLASGTVGFLAWQKRRKPVAKPLLAMMLASVVWGGGTLVYRYGVLSGSSELAILGTKLTYLGIPVVVTAWFVLALRYAGRDDLLSTGLYVVLGAAPVLVNLVVWTAEMHTLWWSDFGAGTSQVVTYGDWGVLFYLYMAYGYALTLGGAVFVLRQVSRSKNVYRGQAFSMVTAAVVPLVGNVLFVGLGLAGSAAPDLTPAVASTRVPDFTPVAFAISGVALVFGIFRFGLTEVAPVAHDTVLDNITDGVFVLDADDQFVEANPRATEILGVADQRVVGRSFADVLGDNPAVYERYADATDVTEEIALDTDDGRRYYEVEVSSLSTDGGEAVGRLFIVREVTDRKQREQELERQNEQLERFTTIVSHDLREPLATAEQSLVSGLKQGDRGQLRQTREALTTIDEIVDDMVTLAQQGETIADDDQEFVALRDVAREAWNNLDTRAASLTVESDQYVRADRRRLVRLFETLFQNSVEHAGEDVTVRVGGLGSTGSLLNADEQGFFVADDGPGIPQAAQERVLEAGYSTDGDTGLGLAIVASTAEAHGWGVQVTAASDGGFRIEFTGAVVD
ncbi:histidine kinase N-terminal 7TM domain-containing protein [Haloarchaeobius sp. DFWS5]|uniref:histidine kinase N-terminal 7TM domain-containing protein n=1 Tax=Haloarchaeobius sp. DFWS5 TaxID=3446114 RepID=UPI003EB78089